MEDVGEYGDVLLQGLENDLRIWWGDGYQQTNVDAKIYEGSNLMSLNLHRYEVFDGSMNWHEARDTCEAMGASLATFHSDADVAMLPGDIDLNRKWIGGTWSDSWGWSDETAMDWTYWAPGEPNGNANEPCIVTWNG